MPPGNLNPDPRLYRVSKNFTLWETYKSQTADRKGINNVPPDVFIPNLIRSADLLEQVRTLLGGRPISPSSWYRGPALNTAVGGARNSQHLTGCAIDFDCDSYGTPLDICRTIIVARPELAYEQLILEHTWVHISVPTDPSAAPKRQVLSLLTGGKYATGLTNINGVPYGSV